MRRVAPYLMAVVGAIAITIAIGLVSARFPIPGLSSLYLLWVLWLGAQYGIRPLLRQVWGEYAVGDKYNTRYVVAQIRKKLGDNPSNPKYIVSEPGVGYRLQA